MQKYQLDKYFKKYYKLSQIFLRKSLGIISKILLFSIPSIFLTLSILEIILRLLFTVSDVPDIYFNPSLGNTFVPNQQGLYIKGSDAEIKAKYRINNSGWNSPNNYIKEKSSDIFRIAFIGDSFIEALQIDYDKSYPYLLEKKFNTNLEDEQTLTKILPHGKEKKIEVYTFGHSGANLIHYGHMMEYASSEYKPDLIFVNIVTNDFKESLYEYSRIDNWSIEYKKGEFNQRPPKIVNNLLIKRALRKSALVRFMTINLDLINKSPILNKLFYAETRHNQINVDLEQAFLSDEFLNKLFEYILDQYLYTSKKLGVKFVLVLDSDRNALYLNKDPQFTESYRYNLALKKIAKQKSIEVIDLSDSFKQEWLKNKKMFNWEIDDHWNEYGHQVVSESILKWSKSYE